MNPAIWSKTERMLLDVLTNRVAVLRLIDARRVWRSHASGEPFRRGLARLAHANLIQVYDISVRRAADASRPVCSLIAGKHQVVDCAAVSECLRTRWSAARYRTRVISASRLAANLFGSSAFGLPNLGHREHDVLLGTVYTHYATHLPQQARRWVGEHALPKAGYRIKDPDAFLIDQGAPFRIIESGGSYGVSQVESLVRFAAEHELELEVW